MTTTVQIKCRFLFQRTNNDDETDSPDIPKYLSTRWQEIATDLSEVFFCEIGIKLVDSSHSGRDITLTFEMVGLVNLDELNDFLNDLKMSPLSDTLYEAMPGNGLVVAARNGDELGVLVFTTKSTIV